MLAVSLSRCMKVPIRKYSAHRFIPGVVFKRKIDRLLLFIVAISSDPFLYFSCRIVRKSSGVHVLRSANGEIPFLGW